MSTVKIRRSGTTTSTPSSLDHGELAINYADSKLFWKDASNTIQSFVFQAYANATHTHSADAITSGTVAYARLPVGSTASTVCAGDDARLSNARTPTAHKASHATGGSDALTPSDIGAAPAASPTFTGTVTVPGLTSTGVILADDAATANSVVYSFDGDPNTGIGRGGADILTIVTAGSERVRVKSGGAVRYVPLTADPASGEAGDVYYNSTLNKLRVYNGSRWVSLHGAAWDISTARYVQEFSVAAQETDPRSISFKPDGTKVYVLGSAGDDVNQYDLSVPWDISTATYIQNFSVSAQDNTPQGLFFRADGMKMFMVGSQNDAVYEYTLTTAWDISTASYASNSFSVAAAETGPTGLYFKPDGTKMFTIGTVNDYVDEYDLSTAWDISTAILGHSHLISGQEANPTDIFFSPDGLTFYIVGTSGDGIDQYVLGEAWELSEITSNPTHAQFRSFASEDAGPNGLAFSPDGLNLYLVGVTNDKIFQYRLS